MTNPGAQYLAELTEKLSEPGPLLFVAKEKVSSVLALLASEKARADAAEAYLAEYRDHAYPFQKDRADTAEATIASLTEQLAEAREGVVYETYDGKLFRTLGEAQEYSKDRPFRLGMMGWRKKYFEKQEGEK